jgi:hypothetical protein
MGQLHLTCTAPPGDVFVLVVRDGGGLRHQAVAVQVKNSKKQTLKPGNRFIGWRVETRRVSSLWVNWIQLVYRVQCGQTGTAPPGTAPSWSGSCWCCASRRRRPGCRWGPWCSGYKLTHLKANFETRRSQCKVQGLKYTPDLSGLYLG